ncbi:MAG TPA: PIG-L family deacetylase [Glaciihabitans sp.]|nr:PIG-L family deacetylase [Glaciihabitans sp.]
MSYFERATMSEQERVLFVHAHPDDESISTGGTLATLVERGAQVTVLTCTRGERGEVIPAELQHLLDSHHALASEREGELTAALGALGVTDQRYLGDANARWAGREPRRYLDSGMVWGQDGAEATGVLDPDSLTAADFGEVASDIAAVIADIRPHVVISYNDFGGYGHPDHIRAAQAAERAADVYDIPFYAVEPDSSAATPTITVDVSPVLERKRAALAAHRTQIVVDGTNFALSNGVSQPISEVEMFRRVHRVHPHGLTPFAEQSVGVKIFAAVLGLAVGIVVGAILTVAHEASVTIGGLPIPYGLIAAIVIVTCLLVGLRLVFGTRTVAAAAAAGLVIAVAALSLRSAGGSVLVGQTSSGFVWAIAPTLIAVIVVGWPQLPSRSRDKIGTPQTK